MGQWRLSEDFETRLYERAQVPIPEGLRPKPDCAWIHRELRRRGVTLELLHHEYLEHCNERSTLLGILRRYHEFRNCRRLSMCQHHVAGDKMFVDYSGKRGRSPVSYLRQLAR